MERATARVVGGTAGMAANHAIEHPTSTGLDNRKMAMWSFLASDCMFFGSLITVYLVAHGRAVV